MSDPIVALNRDEFLSWLSRGVMHLSAEHSSLRRSPEASGQPPLFYVQLPGKYRRALASDGGFLALIDEIQGVSLATEELTEEWRLRLKNLGEEWLPFQFREEWLPSGPTLPAEPPPGADAPPEVGDAAPELPRRALGNTSWLAASSAFSGQWRDAPRPRKAILQRRAHHLPPGVSLHKVLHRSLAGQRHVLRRPVPLSRTQPRRG